MENPFSKPIFDYLVYYNEMFIFIKLNIRFNLSHGSQ